MQMIRSMNIVILACLLILTGCFGVADDAVSPPAEGQDSTSTTVNINHSPNIDAYFNSMFGIDENLVFDAQNSTYSTVGANVSMYHSAIDIDGESMTMGWDTDLDGIIDINVSGQSGFTMLYLPLSAWHYVPGTIGEFTSTLAFIAIDVNGAGESQLVHINAPQFISSYQYSIYVITADGNTSGDGPTTATDDSLVMMTLIQGSDLNWAAVSVKISINDGAPLTCPKDSGENAQCIFVEYGTNTSDQVWSVGDGFIIYEAGQNLCDDTATCNIEITITNIQAGEVIDTSSATAA
ncbi:MAG: hypothetical protein HN554_00060 [Euryarchaeota archaeon]|nr:hypothetical protein [Euryarchaeota archaeon]